MTNAIKAVRGKETGLKKTSKVFEVPRSILKNKVDGKETDIKRPINTRVGRKPVLPYNLEELLGYCLTMERKYFGAKNKKY